MKKKSSLPKTPARANISLVSTRAAEAGIFKAIGKKLSARRIQLGMSQSDISDMLGVSYQQVQKLEKGVVRMSLIQMVSLAHKMSVDVHYFLDEVKSANAKGVPPLARIAEEEALSRETLDLVKAYRSVKDPELRKVIKITVKKMATVTAYGGDKEG